MTSQDLLAEQFEDHRTHLRAVAYRILGSLSEADDAVQEAWIRLSTSSTDEVENMRAWLTTVVARVCLNALRSRTTRHEEPLGVHVPEPIVSPQDGVDPEHEALLADSVGLALLVVLEQLTPAERLAYVLHDMFAVPFDEIAPIVDRSPTTARQLASRARRRIRGAPTPDGDLPAQRRVVDAFFAAARRGDFDALVAVLHPDVTLRADFGDAPILAARELHGPEAVAGQALLFARVRGDDAVTRPALVNGAVGVVAFRGGRPFAVQTFTVTDGQILEIDVLADPKRLSQLDLTGLT